MTQISKIADLAIEMNDAINVIKHVLISYKTIDYNDNQVRIKHKEKMCQIRWGTRKRLSLNQSGDPCLGN